MQLKKSYMYYKSAIKPEICKKIISHGLSKMVVDESKGISRTASTFDGKEMSLMIVKKILQGHG